MNLIFHTVRETLRTMDKLVLLLCAILSTVSVTLLYGLNLADFVAVRALNLQCIISVVGIFAAIVLSAFDPEELARMWRLYLPPSVICMVLTFFFGIERDGSNNRSWLNIGFTTIQPSEFLKIAFILSLSWHLSQIHEELNTPKNLACSVAHALFPVMLVILQKDDGVALIVLCIVACILFSAGFSRRLIIASIVASVLGLFAIFHFELLSEFQLNRIFVVLQRDLDPQGIGYQQLRGLTAMGSGQVFGIGLHGDHLYVPENYNDFIFTFLGETFGFVGCMAVLLILLLLCIRILQIGFHARNAAGRFICVGVFAMITFQSIVNISMCLMIMPVIGVTLPFLSAGGSSVLATYIGIGLVLAVDADAKRNTFVPAV